MNCRHHIAVLAVALFVSAAGVAFAATPYYLTDLGTPGYSSSANAVATMNGKPVIVGSGQVTSTSTVDACYWTPSGSGFALTDVGPQVQSALGSTIDPGYVWSSSYCTGVNSSGQIVGMYTGFKTDGSNTMETFGFVYTIGGIPTQATIPASDAFVSAVGDINNSGNFVATYTIGMLPEPCPAIINAGTGATTYPGGYGDGGTGYNISAAAINANGFLAGYGDNPSTLVQDAYGWNGSAWIDIPGYAGRGTISRAIDSNGNIVGASRNSSNKNHPFYAPYTGSTWGAMVDLGLNGSNTSGSALGINDNGQMVGWQSNSTNTATAYTWSTTPGSGVPLSTLVSGGTSWTFQQATAVNNQCDIVGDGTDALGNNKAFLLTALPGDANLDGRVDINDLTIVLAHYGQTGTTWAKGEFTGDGTVDINDLTIVLAHYGQTRRLVSRDAGRRAGAVGPAVVGGRAGRPPRLRVAEVEIGACPPSGSCRAVAKARAAEPRRPRRKTRRYFRRATRNAALSPSSCGGWAGARGLDSFAAAR